MCMIRSIVVCFVLEVYCILHLLLSYKFLLLPCYWLSAAFLWENDLRMTHCMSSQAYVLKKVMWEVYHRHLGKC